MRTGLSTESLVWAYSFFSRISLNSLEWPWNGLSSYANSANWRERRAAPTWKGRRGDVASALAELAVNRIALPQSGTHAPKAFGAMSKTGHGTAALTAVPGTHGVEYRIRGDPNQGFSERCMVVLGDYFLMISCRAIFSDNYRYFVGEF